MESEFFTSQVRAWSSPPVDDVGYISSSELLNLPDDKLRAVMDEARVTRYGGWRNHDGKWRDLMGLDSIHGKDVIDWGCGTGIEARELASRGNRVVIADICPGNIVLAAKVLSLYGYQYGVRAIDPVPPFIPDAPGRFDVFYMSGVLHHIPEPEAVMERAAELLRPGGEARVMVYSDKGWQLATGTEPPDDVTGHPQRDQFTRFFDEVGDWADWYDRERLEKRFGDWFTVERFSYLTPDDRYCATVMKKR